MHKINYSVTAYKDIENILLYISHNLNNQSAAIKLRNKIISSEKIVSMLPHIGSKDIDENGKEYYKYKIKNYYIIYTVNEKNKIINILRILYSKRNYQTILNKNN